MSSTGLRLTLSMSSLLVGLLLLELVLRVYGFDPLGGLIRGTGLLVRQSDYAPLRYEPIPGAEGPGFQTFVKISSQGLRDREYELEKGDAYRIVVVGDSITFGNMLPEEVLYPTVLEASLNARPQGRVEVLNLGVGGYDVVQDVARLEHAGVRFSPDLVVLGFCTNDLGWRSMALSYIEHLSELESPLYRLRVVQFADVMLDRFRALWGRVSSVDEREFFEANRSYIKPLDDDPELLALLADVRERAEQVRGSRSLSFLRQHPAPLVWYGSEWRVGMLRYSFEWLARLRDQYGFEALVLVVPRLAQDDYGPAYRIVAHEAGRVGVPVLELTSAFEEVGFDRLRIYDVDKMHPNELGHEIIARELGAWIDANGALHGRRTRDAAMP
jgi:lysophospholipase L1-like esterase